MAAPSQAKNNGAPYTYHAPPASISSLFEEGKRLHQADRFAEAEAIYRRVTEADPNHTGAWHLMGLACVGQNKNPQAIDAFQHALALSPDHVEALTQLGIALARLNRLPEAMTRLRRAIELKTDNGQAHNNLGVVLTQLGRHDEGMACYQEAARVQPDYAEAHFNVAISLSDRKQNGEAIAAYERAIKARPDHVDAMFNLGLLLLDERRPADAVGVLEQAVRLKPAHPEGHNNLSLALADLGRFDDALTCLDAALRLNPFHAKAHANRGNALTALGRIDEAVACYDQALRLQPDYASARWNRSLAWLTDGDFKRGFAEYEWRWQRNETKIRNFPEPAWDGSSLQGKTILLWCEQGFGDTLQFVRYAAMLKEQGATVWLECPARMIPLLSRTPGIDRWIAEGTPLPAGFDCQVPLMSLPLRCGTTSVANVPADMPYLSVEPTQLDQWKKELAGSTAFKIGIAWQGNPGHRYDLHRSFPLRWFASLAAMKGVELYSLQKGPGALQLKEVRFPVIDLGSRLDETAGAFTDTAAAMQALDLVITCDSSLAHLAGALNVPVWVALATPADWRWMQDTNETPWYPSMRFFRQPKLGQWRPVFEAMRDSIETLKAKRCATAIHVEIAPGELLDKLTILQIKSERITDADKLRNVNAELAVVEKTKRQTIREMTGLEELIGQLKEVNERLWDIENDIRDCEKAEDFGPKFIELARAVYQTNDRRAALKRQVNELLGAAFREEKEYHGA